MCLQQASAMHLGFGADTAGSGQTLLYVGCVMHSINIYTSITCADMGISVQPEKER